MQLSHISAKPLTTTSHQQNIWKKVLIPNGKVPHITQYAIAKFKPGQVVEDHAHSDMYEVFFVVSGTGKIVVNAEEHQISTGTVFIIEPNDTHSVENTGDKELVLQYFGVLK
jgi:quercetin dioxygenase-like cupin family protein